MALNNTAIARTAARYKQLLISQFSFAGTADKNMRPGLVPVTIRLAPGQTGNALEVQDSTGAVLLSIGPTGIMTEPNSAAAGLGDLRVAHAIYNFAVDGGAVGAITPVQTAVLPANAILVGGTVNVPTAVLSGGSATVSVGTTAGSSAAALLAATAKATLSIDANLNLVPVFATPVKMSAAGSINITVATAALTAGLIEVFVLYYVAANA